MLKTFKIYTCTNGSLGLHLSRAPWDPYPWVSSIQRESNSFAAGLRVGDTLLELNGRDVLGLKISDIAGLLKNHWLTESSNHVNVVIWRNRTKDGLDHAEADDDNEDDDEDEENNAHNINQQSLQKFATCLQHIAQLLECPVCLEVIRPPGWQCCNGHVLCNNCRSRSEKCPVCRVPLGPRGRCLLSDKLFTLLAESFPCDGVRSNKNSPRDRRKCSTEFHNQPKMAIVQPLQQQNGDAKAKDFKKTEQDFILRSLGIGRRRRTKSKKEEDECEQGEQTGRRALLQRGLSAIVHIKGDECGQRVSSGPAMGQLGGGAATTGLQCHCRMCCKPSGKTAAAGLPAVGNKCVLRVEAERPAVEGSARVKNCQKYQCPTGKLCCLQVQSPVDGHLASHQGQSDDEQMANNNLSTYSFKTLHSEWEILAHLTQDHQSAVNQYYAQFGQRIAITQDVLHGNSIICLNLRGADQQQQQQTANAEKFFVAFVPLAEQQTDSPAKVAVFVWHMNSMASNGDHGSEDCIDEVSNFDAIIENPKTGIKWFGPAHCLTTPWSRILHKRHFLMHELMRQHSAENVTAPSGDAFVIVIKEKS